MSKKTKSWRERLKTDRSPETKLLSSPFAGMQAGTLMLVSTPREINEWVGNIPFGQIRTVDDMKYELAQRHSAEAACPASTAIFLRVVADAAWEDLQNGAQLEDVTPFWRITEPESKIAKKLSCDPEFIRIERKREQRTSNSDVD